MFEYIISIPDINIQNTDILDKAKGQLMWGVCKTIGNLTRIKSVNNVRISVWFVITCKFWKTISYLLLKRSLVQSAEQGWGRAGPSPLRVVEKQLTICKGLVVLVNMVSDLF